MSTPPESQNLPRETKIALVVMLVVVAALIGGCAGLNSAQLGAFPGALFQRTTVEEVPLPHQVPKYPAGVSLRLVMVHDVLHDRYARHGDDYYLERNRRARLALGRDRGPKSFALADDLGAGLDLLGEHDEAVRVLRDKLARQEKLGHGGRELYTTYANLGTFLIHGSFRKAVAGDAAAREALREGLKFIRLSIEVNPQAHFGREVWQAVAAEFFLAAMADPKLLLRYDMIGNRLDEDPNPSRGAMQRPSYSYRGGIGTHVAAFLAAPADAEPGTAEQLRQGIATVGAEAGWAEAVKTSHTRPVPFDEPVLGIIGMWRLGGGPNPHFCLALGETMLRVGQRYLAWSAFERGARLAERFWPDPKLRQAYVDHCRRRQALIRRSLPSDEVERLRPRFDAELAHGRRYQQAYQRFEAEQIRGGASLDDPHFYDAFYRENGRVASPPGKVDWGTIEKTTRRPGGSAVFAAGVGAFLAAVAAWLVARHTAAARQPAAS